MRITIDSCTNGAFNGYSRSSSRRFFAVDGGAFDTDYRVDIRNMDQTLTDATVTDTENVSYSVTANIGTDGQVLIGQSGLCCRGNDVRTDRSRIDSRQ